MTEARSLEQRIEGAFSGLSKVQQRFLEAIAEEGGDPTELLKSLKLSARKLGEWILNPQFRGAFLLVMDARERMFLPAAIEHCRTSAMGESREARHWMKLYLEVMNAAVPVQVVVEAPDTGESKEEDDALIDDLT